MATQLWFPQGDGPGSLLAVRGVTRRPVEDVLGAPARDLREALRADEAAERVLARPARDDEVRARAVAHLAIQVRLGVSLHVAHHVEHALEGVLEHLLLALAHPVVHPDRDHG